VRYWERSGVKNRKRANGPPSTCQVAIQNSHALVQEDEIKKREFYGARLETLVDTLRDVRGYPNSDVTSFSFRFDRASADHEDAGFSSKRLEPCHRSNSRAARPPKRCSGDREARRVKPGEGRRGIGRLDNSLLPSSNGSSP